MNKDFVLVYSLGGEMYTMASPAVAAGRGSRRRTERPHRHGGVADGEKLADVGFLVVGFLYENYKNAKTIGGRSPLCTSSSWTRNLLELVTCFKSSSATRRSPTPRMTHTCLRSP